jgi:NADH dehydrogenase FAD-containing subunit
VYQWASLKNRGNREAGSNSRLKPKALPEDDRAAATDKTPSRGDRRRRLRGHSEATTLLASVSGVDANGKRVLLDDGDALPHDTLILATGVRHACFGHDEWEPFAHPVQSK